MINYGDIDFTSPSPCRFFLLPVETSVTANAKTLDISSVTVAISKLVTGMFSNEDEKQ